MEHQSALDILKMAILLEKRGKAFYEAVAREATHPGIRNVFEIMASEEDGHVELLSDQYRRLAQGDTFAPLAQARREVADLVLTPEMKQGIASAGYEAAAISAAMGMEQRAVDLYAERSRSATDPAERAMYQWLADWEKTHLNLLTDLDRELQQAVWHDQGFWPVL